MNTSLVLNLFLYYSACCDLWHIILNFMLLEFSFPCAYKKLILWRRLNTLVPSLLGFKVLRASILEVSPPDQITEFNVWSWIEWSWALIFPIRNSFPSQRQIPPIEPPKLQCFKGDFSLKVYILTSLGLGFLIL